MIHESLPGMIGFVIGRTQDAPVAFEFAFAEWQNCQGVFRNLTSHRPLGQDCYAEFPPDHFFDGFEIAQLEKKSRLKTVAVKIFFKQLKSIAAGAMHDEFLRSY